jgi:hypothetical protein
MVRIDRGHGGGCRGGCAVDAGLGGHAHLVSDVLSQQLEPIGHTDLGLGHKVHRTQLQRLEGDLGTALGQR